MKGEVHTRFRSYWPYLVFIPTYLIIVYLITIGRTELLGYFMMATVIGIVPASITISVAVPFAYYYVILHRKFLAPKGSVYGPNPAFQHTPPRLRVVAKSIVVGVFGIMFLIVSALNFNQNVITSPTGVLLVILSIFLALFLSPSLNIASWLLTRTGYMYEYRAEGTRVNIGRDLRSKLEYAIGPIAALQFLRLMFISYHDIGPVLALVIVTLIISAPSAFVTILLLRRKHLNKMSTDLEARLAKLIT